MPQIMSDDQKTVRNTDEFIKHFALLSKAAIGVTVCRTREPFRCADSLREYAAMTSNEFRMWSVTRGWELYNNEDPSAPPTSDSVTEPTEAFPKVNAPDTDFAERGVYVLLYPQAMLKMALIKQIIKEQAHSLNDSYRRLVLLVPPGFEMPEELVEDVVQIDFATPSFAELSSSFSELRQMMLDNGGGVTVPADDAQFVERVVMAGMGMTAFDFENAVSRALALYTGAGGDMSEDDFVKEVTKVKTEVVNRSQVLTVMEPGRMEDIGGLENLKHYIEKRALCFSEEARAAGVETPKGIALIGPPGTGKSLGAKAVASALNIPALKFDVGAVFDKFVGNSESRVREALAMVDAMSPCVLMIDEADKAFAGQAGGNVGGDSGVGQRVLGALLTWMQETTSPVFMVVTANRVQNLPTEFLRRGRLDEIFSVTLPHEGEREEIIRIHLRKRKEDPDKIEGIKEAAAQSAGYVPAELEAAVKDAKLEAFVAGVPLTGAHIIEQLGFIRPLSVSFAEDFERMERWAVDNARPASLPEGSTVESARSVPSAQGVASGSARTRTRRLALDG